MSSLLDHLGRPDDARLALVVCDGLGSSNAANLGVYGAIRNGVGTSASLQMPCPWARGAAIDYHGDDVGVALTVNAEHDTYRWGPITHAPSLLDGDGGFPRTPADLWEHADLEEIRRECRAQVERAVLWGFDITHLSAHLHALCARPEFFDVYLDLALDFALPISLPEPCTDLGFPARELAHAESILFADDVVTLPHDDDGIATVLDGLRPGVTELHLRPAFETPELRAITPEWPDRVADAELAHSQTLRQALAERSIELISFRDLRAAQRSLDHASHDHGHAGREV